MFVSFVCCVFAQSFPRTIDEAWECDAYGLTTVACRSRAAVVAQSVISLYMSSAPSWRFLMDLDLGVKANIIGLAN